MQWLNKIDQALDRVLRSPAATPQVEIQSDYCDEDEKSDSSDSEGSQSSSTVSGVQTGNMSQQNDQQESTKDGLGEGLEQSSPLSASGESHPSEETFEYTRRKAGHGYPGFVVAHHPTPPTPPTNSRMIRSVSPPPIEHLSIPTSSLFIEDEHFEPLNVGARGQPSEANLYTPTAKEKGNEEEPLVFNFSEPGLYGKSTCTREIVSEPLPSTPDGGREKNAAYSEKFSDFALPEDDAKKAGLSCSEHSSSASEIKQSTPDKIGPDQSSLMARSVGGRNNHGLGGLSSGEPVAASGNNAVNLNPVDGIIGASERPIATAEEPGQTAKNDRALSCSVDQRTENDMIEDQDISTPEERGGVSDEKEKSPDDDDTTEVDSEKSSSEMTDSNQSGDDEMVDETGDYEISLPLTPWNEMVPDLPPFQSSMNRHGVVHVRILRAQSLPCGVGSTVQAVIALPPWKGRIRTEKVLAYEGPSGAGVCIRWDRGHDEDFCCSMVHAWNSEDTPVPSITIDLVSLSLQMFEYSLCSLKLSCHVLMRSPGVWTRNWCPADLTEKTPRPSPSPSPARHRPDLIDKSNLAKKPIPFVLVEACFVPTAFDGEPFVTTTENASVASFKLKGKTGSDARQRTLSAASSVVDSTINGELSRQKTSSSVMTTPKTPRTKALPEKSHLFRVTSFWVPAFCCVCSSLLTGWRRQCYRCEVCKIDCCNDCLLQVDVQIPCGSDKAKACVEHAVQNKVSMSNIRMSMGNVLHVVAPIHPEDEKITDLADASQQARQENASDQRQRAAEDSAATLPSPDVSLKQRDGIGVLRLRIVGACLYARAFPPEAALDQVFRKDSTRALRTGDHYVRISWIGSEETRRTKTVQNTARPLFSSDDMNFVVSHYGMEYKLEVIDANTDRPVGTTLISAQQVLQWQRDWKVEEEGFHLFSFLTERRQKIEKKRVRLELRTGIKGGFGLDFYNASRTSDTSSKKNESTRSGEISGWIDIDICLQEDIDDLIYATDPRECPPRPPDDFDVNLIQIHVARIGAIVDDLKKAVDDYLYLISWENPALTSLSLILFVWVTVRFNTEYFGSIPVFILILYMMRLAKIRREGRFKDRFTKKEKDATIQTEKKVAVNYSIHRPIGHLDIAVLQGKNLRSRDFGLPGSVCCRVFWDPGKYMANEMREKLIKHDLSVKACHEIGATSSVYSTNPVWEKLDESFVLQRLKNAFPGSDVSHQYVPKKYVSSRNTDGEEKPQWRDISHLHFPLLQPIAVDGGHDDDKDSKGSKSSGIRLVPWESSKGAVVLQVRFQDVINKLPGFDDVLGEVPIPLSRLTREGEIEGWFRVLEVGTKETVKGEIKEVGGSVESDVNSKQDPKSLNRESEEVLSSVEEYPEIYLRVRFIRPEDKKGVSDTELEGAIVVAEEMVRSASMSEEKIGIIGSSVSTFNTVRGLGGNVQYIQNTLGSVLDTAEAIRNAFNFTCPYKSTLLFALLVVLWLLLAIIPTRVLILCGGVGQYIGTFIAAFGPESTEKVPKSETKPVPSAQVTKPSPVVTKLLNMFRSLPTDEDLRRVYFWESRRVGERERERLATKKRVVRLQRLWKAQWHGTLELKIKSTQSMSSGRKWDWEPIFAIIQGHRFMWWGNEKEFDDGETPQGRILFSGHSGLAGLSPLELRELRKDEIPLVVNIFGRGENDQQKISLLTPDMNTKKNLEVAVMEASCDFKKD